MIEVSGLKKNYGSKAALKGISFKIGDGEIAGFLGPNGAGKSTAMNIITGYLSAGDGTVKVGGMDVLENPAETRKMVGFLPEIPPLYMDMTVEEYLSFVYELKKCTLNRKKHMDDVCSLVKIESVRSRLIKNLSKGYRQRVGMAQALIGNPPVLILDEPTAGLDPKQITEMRELIRKLGRSHTVMLSSHILSDVQAVCDRIIIINEGLIVADGGRDSLLDGVSGEKHVSVSLRGGADEVLKELKRLKSAVSVESSSERSCCSDTVYKVRTRDFVSFFNDVYEISRRREWPVSEMHAGAMSLEEIFMRLTDGEKSTGRRGSRK